MQELTFQFLSQICQSFQIVPRMRNATLGLTSSFLVLGNAGRLFNINSKVLRAGFNQLTDHALFNNGVTSRPQARTEEKVCDVLSTTPVLIQEIGRLPVTTDLTLDGDLTVRSKFAPDAPIGIIEDELDTCLPHRFSSTGAIEDHIGH